MTDDFFSDDSDDPFDNLVNQFFGHNKSKSAKVKGRRVDFSDNEEDLSAGECIEDNSIVYLLFEIPGFSEKDIRLAVKEGILEINAMRKSSNQVPDYLAAKMESGVIFKRSLPSGVSKKFTHTYKNGILEVVFEKI